MRLVGRLVGASGCRTSGSSPDLSAPSSMLVRIPPKYAVAEVIGYVKGKSAIAVARQFSGRKRNFNGEQRWARGYAVWR
jgi:hypothetical protein